MKIPIKDSLALKLKMLYEYINQANGIIITGHISPDGDDIGSQLAIGEYLYNIGKPFIIIDGDNVPDELSFLPNIEWIRHIETIEAPDTEKYDTMIVVDSGDLFRIGDVQKLAEGRRLINIDHHLGNSEFGILNIVEDNASCIGEILYYFFQENSIEISYNIAVDLYVSLVSDTGSFRYDQMHPEVHLIAAELMKKGVVPADFNIYLYQSKPIEYVKLISLMLSRMQIVYDGKVAYSYLTYKDFEDIGYSNTDGIIEQLGIIKDVSVYFLVKEKSEGFFSASLRSKFNVDVAEIASHFGGGGHMRAAGCRMENTNLNEFISGLLKEIKKNLD